MNIIYFITEGEGWSDAMRGGVRAQETNYLNTAVDAWLEQVMRY